jgi:hypothetical protein
MRCPAIAVLHGSKSASYERFVLVAGRLLLMQDAAGD